MNEHRRTGFRGRRAERGAALMYALLVVFILSLIVLGMTSLITSHIKDEDTNAVYSRLLYSAETAANWQLLQVSAGAGNGRVSLMPQDTTALINGDFAANSTIQLSDTVQTWIQGTSGAGWTAPNDFLVYSIAKDTRTGIQRGVSFLAHGTSLADRYVLFGDTSLTFTNTGSQKIQIERGYVGSNATISFSGTTQGDPQTSPIGGFRGCLLTGPNAAVAGSNIPGWDYPQLPDKAYFPLISQIVPIISNGGQSANNTVGAIQAMTQVFPYSTVAQPTQCTQFSNMSAPVTKLTPAEFNQSDDGSTNGVEIPTGSGKYYHVIRLHSNLVNNGTQGPNVFYFSDINMRPTDILLLEVRQPTNGNGSNATACHIVVQNATQPIVITNVAIVQVTQNKAVLDMHGSFSAENYLSGISPFIIYNDTNQPLTIQPAMSAFANGSTIFFDSTTTGSNYPNFSTATDYPALIYTLTPGWPGLVYGITNKSGSIVIDGTPSSQLTAPINIVAAIGNQVTVKGNVTVGPTTMAYNGTSINTGNEMITRDPAIQSDLDPFRYYYFYHVRKSYQEVKTTAPFSAIDGIPYGYGGSPQ